LKELFGTNDAEIGISYLRISIGASDLSDHVYSYDDIPLGQADPNLEHFNIDMEKKDLIPVLKQILEINPNVSILGSPWSAPAWMKDNNDSKGGSLKPEYFEVYAMYFVKYIKAMKNEGINIKSITIQNEPLHPGNNPSMFMSADDQRLFLKNYLVPAFERNNIKTKIVLYDHNADRIDYPISILNDIEARKYADGSAFHLYAGEISELTNVHNAHPDKNIYFTEQWIGAPSNFAGDFSWHINNLIIGGTRNWCKNVLEWNLSSNPQLTPHTDRGGCSNCLGGITIDGDKVIRNPGYYIIAHASKFIRPGSIRIGSNIPDNLNNAAFETPDGKIVLIVQNNITNFQKFYVQSGKIIFVGSLNGGCVATYYFNLQDY
jgi:glucosylceramidase